MRGLGRHLARLRLFLALCSTSQSPSSSPAAVRSPRLLQPQGPSLSSSFVLPALELSHGRRNRRLASRGQAAMPVAVATSDGLGRMD